jgi:diguanylate cyclase (GGDEF)-like protein
MTIQNKFILVLLSIIVSIVSLITYLNIEEDEKTFNIQFENRANFMKAQMLKNAEHTIYYHKVEIENDLASMNLSGITNLLKVLAEREEIEGVSLVSDNREMQLFEGRPYHKSVKKELVVQNDANIIIATPIVLSKYWGTFPKVDSLKTLDKEMKKARQISLDKKRRNIQNAILLAFIIFMVFSVFVFFWAKRLVSPIVMLTKAAKNISEGKLQGNEDLLHINRNDEVGILAKAFEEMSLKLSNSYKELNELNDSLEERIQERTKDLVKSKEELKLLASIDPMTKLYNRRYFSEISEDMFGINKRKHANVSLILLDIDTSKTVNDIYGHHIGDDVIISIANILMDNTRKNDVVCRYGGEEYIILLPDTDIKSSMKIAHNIRQLVENLLIKLPRDKELKVTISIGVSMANMIVDNDIEIAINKADNAMYEAKRAGKNRVVQYTEEYESKS